MLKLKENCDIEIFQTYFLKDLTGFFLRSSTLKVSFSPLFITTVYVCYEKYKEENNARFKRFKKRLFSLD